MCAVRCLNKTIMFAVIKLDTLLKRGLYNLWFLFQRWLIIFSPDFINELVRNKSNFDMLS